MDHLDDNVLTAYLEHLLPPEKRRAVEAHLDVCEDCLAITCEVVRSAQPEWAVANAATTPARDIVEGAAEGALAIGRYEIRELIGRGGMGTVYVAYDPQLERRIALKVVRTSGFEDPSIRERLSREARAMAKIRHTNVVSVYDAGELDDGVFIAMELIDGVTLTRWQAEAKRDWRAIVTMYLAVGRGLVAAHAADVVHRDFKPDNVLVDRDGHPAVTDFGLAVGLSIGAVTLDPDVTRTNAMVGTPRYMSPEQFALQPIDPRSDQFSFAISLYEALYRRPPFPGATATELAANVIAGALEVRPQQTTVPPAVHRVIERALRFDRGARYPSMQALLDELAAALRQRSRRRWFAMGTAGVIAAAVISALALRSGAPSAAPVQPRGSNEGTTPAGRTTLVIAPFANTTGDPRLDDTLDAAVADVIYRSTRLEPLAGLELARSAARVGGDVGAPDALAAKLAEQSGRRVIVVRGSVARDGAAYQVTLGTEVRRVASLDALLGAAAELARGLRIQMGDDPAGVLADPPLASSVEAVHLHAEANRLAMGGDFKAATERLNHALELDPHFVAARVTLGLVLYNLSEQKKAAAAMEAAIADADRLPERLRLQLLGDYYGTIGKNPEAISAYQRYLARWPGDVRTEVNLIATAIDAGDFPLAYELSKQTIAEHPDLGVVRANFVLAELATGRWQDASVDGMRMLAEIPRPTDFGIAFVAMAQVLANGGGGDAKLTWGRLAALNPELAADGMADQAIYEGRLDNALVLLAPYIEVVVAMGKPREGRNEILMRAAIRLARGDREGAAADAALVMGSDEPRPDYIAASLAIQAGHLEGAEEKIKLWQANDLLEWRAYAALLQGDLALARGKAGDAVAAYRDAVRMSPVWITRSRLALGLVAAGAREDARHELDWCLEHRGEGAVFMTPTLSYVVPLANARERLGP